MKRILAIIIASAIVISNMSVLAADGDTVNDFITAEEHKEQTLAAAEETDETDEEVNDDKLTSENMSVQYQAYEQIAGYVADRYIDEDYTAEDIMMLGISKYLETYGDDALVAFLKGALNSLDPYSDFYTYEEYIEYNNQLNKTFYGLGITMQQNGEYVEIVGFVEENGLAQRSGFKEGDKIVKIDGISVVGSSITEVRNLIVGELGTTVNVTVSRDDKEIEIVGTRTAVNDTTVSGGILEGNIGYIKIASFSANTAYEFAELTQMLKENGVSNVILDLRNNPGGLLSVAIDIAKTIIPRGKIVDVSYRDKSMNYSYESELDVVPFNIIALINENTASCAEILASAIQDSDVGKLVGEQTYGKAVIQNVFSLKNGMVFKITVGQYLTRNGNEIGHVGLVPDYEVSNTEKKIDTSGYTKFDFLTPVSVGGSGTNVMAAKERLTLLGYYIGNLGNNVFNVDLEEAIAKFQKDNQLADSGVLDIPTQIKLKEKFENLGTVVDVQMQEAYKMFGGNVEELYG